MLRFRLVLVWLLMAAAPLQGWAAASMLLCGGAAQRAGVHAPAHGAQGSAHDGGTPHVHAGQGAAMHDHGEHQDTAQAGNPGDADPPSAQASHTCGVCAACCHSVALADTPRWAAVSQAPSAGLAAPLVLIRPRPPAVLDKPPRA